MNRIILTAALVVVAAAAKPNEAAAFPRLAQQGYSDAIADSPGGQLRLALMDLVLNVKPEDAPFTKYLSGFMVKTIYGEKAMSEYRVALRIALNRVAAGKNPVPEVDVDGPNGSVAKSKICTLIRVNIKYVPNWTRAAWVLVADRDYLFREAPLGVLPHRETHFGRIVCGIKQNPKTLSAGFILSGYQFIRDTGEKAHSETGHDLLYAAERHPDFEDKLHIQFIDVRGEAQPDRVEVPPAPPAKITYPYNARISADRAFLVDERRVVKLEMHRGDGFQVTNKPNEYGYVWGTTGPRKSGAPAVEGFILLDSVAFDPERNPKPAAKDPPRVIKGAKGVPLIPKNPVSVDDANKGKKDFPATLKDFQKRWGVRGRQEKFDVFLFDPAVGGIALAHDSDPDNGSFVAAGGDRVVKVESGEFGAVMTTFDSFAAKDGNDQIERDQFFNITQGIIKFDGGESLATMPNGMQAEFLFNADEKSVDIADTRLAKHLEGQSTDPRFPDVRVGHCASCHATSDGYNEFIEQFADTKSKGIKFKIPEGKEQEVQDFYIGWKRQIRRWRLPYQEFREMVSINADGEAIPGTEMWRIMRTWRDNYDKPVNIRYVAAELGMPVEDLRWAILQKKEGEEPPLVRLNQLAVDKLVPKTTYQANVSQAGALWLDLVQPKHEKIRALVAPQVLEDAIRRFGVQEHRP